MLHSRVFWLFWLKPSLTLARNDRFDENVPPSRVFWLFWLKLASLSRVLGVFGIFDNVLRFGDNVLRSGDNVLKSADVLSLSGKVSNKIFSRSWEEAVNNPVRVGVVHFWAKVIGEFLGSRIVRLSALGVGFVIAAGHVLHKLYNAQACFNDC